MITSPIYRTCSSNGRGPVTVPWPANARLSIRGPTNRLFVSQRCSGHTLSILRFCTQRSSAYSFAPAEVFHWMRCVHTPIWADLACRPQNPNDGQNIALLFLSMLSMSLTFVNCLISPEGAPWYTETALDKIKLLQRLITSSTPLIAPSSSNPSHPLYHHIPMQEDLMSSHFSIIFVKKVPTAFKFACSKFWAKI